MIAQEWSNWIATLVRSLCLDDALVNRFAPGESFAYPMPMSDRLLAKFPAQEDNAAVDFTGEIQQANIEIFHLDAHGIDFGHCVLQALNRLLPLRLAAGEVNHIERHATTQEYLMYDCLQLRIHRSD